jgi:hypothetical protein
MRSVTFVLEVQRLAWKLGLIGIRWNSLVGFKHITANSQKTNVANAYTYRSLRNASRAQASQLPGYVGEILEHFGKLSSSRRKAEERGKKAGSAP